MSIPEVGKKIRVSVPSTTANLGPGFDCLGAALDLYNEFIFTRIEGGGDRFDLIMESTDGNIFELNKIKKKNIILYFYPKDDTPGCTLEAKDFSKLNSMIGKKNTVVYGISKDSMESHLKFKKKYKVVIEEVEIIKEEVTFKIPGKLN